LSKNIYVGNLPFHTSESDVQELFEPFGEVTNVAMIRDRSTKRFRGFCFVEMESGADEAIAALDQQDFNGRPLKVNIAKAREDRPGGGRKRRRGGKPGGRPDDHHDDRPLSHKEAINDNRRNFPSGSGHR